MRLTIRLFGIEFFTIEFEQDVEDPIITHTALEDAQRAEAMDPDTVVFGFQ